MGRGGRGGLLITRLGYVYQKCALSKLWTAVYVSNLARIGAKLCQNVFRTIPDVSAFDAEKLFSVNLSDEQKLFFADLVWILTSYDETDVKKVFLSIFFLRILVIDP